MATLERGGEGETKAKANTQRGGKEGTETLEIGGGVAKKNNN